ncbi:MAG: cytochrome c biogenesis heme-transporting ATPase CcmA [Gammaproteobacteria bacterium]
MVATVETRLLAGTELTLWRGTTLLFDALSLNLGPGEALLINGPNGAGKTSLLRVLAGLTVPDGGAVTWNSRSLQAALRTAALRLAFSGHSLALKPELNAHENLNFYARLSGDPERIDEVLATTGLSDCATLPVRLLSAGQKRRVSLARLLLSDTELWLLDEPQTNLDTAGRDLLEQVIATHLQRGGMLVVAAHQALDLGRGAVTRLTLGVN